MTDKRFFTLVIIGTMIFLAITANLIVCTTLIGKIGSNAEIAVATPQSGVTDPKIDEADIPETSQVVSSEPETSVKKPIETTVPEIKEKEINIGFFAEPRTTKVMTTKAGEQIGFVISAKKGDRLTVPFDCYLGSSSSETESGSFVGFSFMLLEGTDALFGIRVPAGLIQYAAKEGDEMVSTIRKGKVSKGQIIGTLLQDVEASISVLSDITSSVSDPSSDPEQYMKQLLKILKIE